MKNEMRILNSMTKRKEAFQPQNEGNVSIYACGITVNGDAHLGHARQAVIFDMIAAYLRFAGYKVQYARNWTDVDDRLIEQAREAGVDFLQLADQRVRETTELIQKITVANADFAPRVSQCIPAIIELVQRLIDKGYAYISQGDVYFDVNSFAQYGKLTNRSTEQLLESVRIERNENKQFALDFALWKGAAPNEEGFDSPFGRGRPGWHIECSAMIEQIFGGNVDIHGGGLDLKFPHHENEIAQSEAANGHPLAKYWMHNGLVTVDGQKMSKSLGNFITLKDLLSRYHPEVIRLLVLSNHYSSSLEMGEESVAAAQKNLYYFYNGLLRAQNALKNSSNLTYSSILMDSFHEFLSDDFNTAGFIAELYTAFTKLNSLKLKKQDELNYAHSLLMDVQALSGVLGFLRQPPALFIEQLKLNCLKKLNVSVEDINSAISRRLELKKVRDFGAADAVRAQLLEAGIVLNDTPQGTQWDIKELY